ncbi:MAG TPA: DUF4159 domain-containing protein [Geminicoccaceae bacterium]|nr:DUF4159 domain-containing protein [Geminicoccaceae bacterium]
MLDLGLLGLTNPWLLIALVSLPALWWLLRVIPPAPRRLRFPTIRFLLGLQPEEETSARTPPWLLLLRLVLAGLLILALAGPVLYPDPELSGRGPLVLVVDDGWGAAPHWDRRIAALERFTARAERQEREVILLGTAPDPAGSALRRLSAADAVRGVAGWLPKAWPVDHDAALAALERETIDDAEIVWLSDGIAEGPEARAAAVRFGEALRHLGPLQVLVDPPAERAVLQQRPEAGDDALVAQLRRPAVGAAASMTVRALGPHGEVLARAPATFDADALDAEARIELPLELRNRIARLELDPPMAVGGVLLLDERWRRRVIGLVGDPAAQAPQPLLSELYYVERALAPSAELRRGSVEDLLAGEISGIVLPDDAQLSAGARTRLADWIEGGGALLRFAGPRLANAEHDDLVPVPLRRGDRNLDGTLSWARPLALTSFDEAGPLAGLRLDEGDVVVHRQVLAQPGPGLAAASWARLADGTPLITGVRRGEGWLILVHTTANTTWSSLPLSGVFVEIMKRFAALGHGAGGPLQGTLAPIEVLDAAGRLGKPGAAVQPLPAAEFAEAVVSARHPPGLYGRIEAGEEAARQALNLASAVPALTALRAADFPVPPNAYGGSSEIDLMPWLLLVAMLLALADTVIGLILRGLLPGRLRPAPVAVLLLLIAAPVGPPARAQDEAIINAISETRLAYVVTGVDEVDEISRAGLDGLSQVLRNRTAVEAGEPRGVNIALDDLDLYPLLYWPVPANHPDLASGVTDRIGDYLHHGGLILFDTGDAGTMIPGQAGPGPGERRLRQLLDGLSLPPLVPVPEDHTLTRSFYLLQDFPGRWTGQTTWVDQADESVNDGVSSVIIGGNDWAGAWAVDEYGRTLLPVLPGGERQREMARRFGVNLVMYALTGNYKTDQVHVPALLERLGQ